MTSFSLSEAELHGLVDGQIEVHRRADILRRAAGSAADRERIGAWQGQREMIRAAFQGIEREPLPSALDLRAPVRLHALQASRPAVSDLMPITSEPERKRGRLLAPSLMAMVAASGLAATWLAGGFSIDVPQAAPSSSEDVVAQRASVALVAGDVAAAPVEAMAMPTTSIPDLTPLGFTLTGAEAQVGDPVSLVFRYRNASAERIAIGVARTGVEKARSVPAAGRQPPGKAVPVGETLVWHAGNRTYALAGNLRPERLRALLASLRDLALEE